MNALAAPSREELQAFLFGSLSEEQSAEMMERIERYPSCQVILDELSSNDALTARLREALPVAPYAREPELREALERASGALGRAHPNGDGPALEPTSDSTGTLPSTVAQSPLPEQLREYELLEVLGEGGMGTVYKARHTRLDKIVALKVLPAERMKKPESVARFHREMKAVGRLDHPNIVRATDAGEVGGTHFLVMEYVAGWDLSRLQQERGVLSVADACEMVRQAAVGLQHAHEHGLVHRDLKPSNLMLTPSGVKVLDLGLARLQSEPEVGELTSEGQVMGTADYMAPEQATSSHDADIRADIYSLGCTLYKLLAGNAPFSGPAYPNLTAKLLAHAATPPQPIVALRPDAPAGLSAVLYLMLAKEKASRYATPGELAIALAPFCYGADLPALLSGTATPLLDRAAADPLAPTQEPHAPGPFTRPDPRPEAPTSPVPAAAPSGRRFVGGFGRRALRVACALGGLAAVVAAALVIRVETDRGELVIRSPDPDVHVTIQRNGQPVQDLTLQTGENTASVRSGNVEVVITGARADSYTVKNNKVTLTRGKTEVVTIERLAVAPPTVALPAEDANRQVAEWVFEHGGSVDIENVPGQVSYPHAAQGLPERVARIVRMNLYRPKPPVSEAELLTQLRRVQGNLDTLDVAYVPLTDAGLAELTRIPALARIRIIRLMEPCISDSGLSHLQAFASLDEVRIYDCGITDQGVRHLRALPKLKHLTLLNTRITDAGLAELHGLKLETLNVAGGPGPGNTEITDVGVTQLADMHSLRRLSLDWTKVGDRGLESLKKLSDLEELGLSCTQITDKGLAVVSSFKNLKHLRVAGLPVTRERLDQICDLPDLHELNFANGGMTFGAADLSALAKLKKLETLELSFNPRRVTDDWLVPLAKLEGLKRLGVINTKVTADGVKRLRAALPRCEIVSDFGRQPASPTLASRPAGPYGDLAPWDLPREAPKPAVVPFTPDQAKQVQKAWADYRKTPVIQINSLGMELRLIPPGEFDMALTTVDLGSLGEYAPVFRVRLDKPFYLGVTEVTLGQFRRFVDETHYKTTADTNGVGGVVDDGTGKWALDPKKKDWSWKNPGPYKPDENEPVCLVTRDDAQAFCEWLGRKEDVNYRLPTEAEWEFASRAGGGGEFGPADDEAGVKAHGWASELRNTPTPAGQSPLHPVATKAANGFGLYDTIGNVWELCIYPVEQSGRVHPNSYPWWLPGALQIRRGGGWYEWAAASFVSHRRSVPNHLPHNCIGFRVLRDVAGNHTPPLRPILVRPGRPLSTHSLVSRPAPIPGLRSWSVERVSAPGIEKVGWSPTGDVIAGGAGDGTVRLWDRECRLKNVLPGHEGSVDALAFSPDGRLLASGDMFANGESPFSTVRVWDMATGSCLAVAPVSGWCRGLAWSPKGDRLAIGGSHSLSLIDVKTGVASTHGGSVMGVCWSPDGTRLATAANDGALRFRDAVTLQPLATVELSDTQGRPASLHSVAWSPDGKWVAAGTGDQISICNAETHQLQRTITDKECNSTDLAWSSDSRRLAATGKNLTLWDALEGKPLLRADQGPGEFSGLAWSPDQSEIATWFSSGRLFVYDATTGKELRRTGDPGQNALCGTAFSPTGDQVVTTGVHKNELAFWDTDTGTLTRRVRLENADLLSWSPRGDLVAAHNHENDSNPILLLDAKTGAVRRRLTGHKGVVPFVAWSSDGAFLAAGWDDKIIRVWETASGQIVHELSGHEGRLVSLAWSPDGKRLASVADDKTLRLWDPKTESQVAIYKDFPEPLPDHPRSPPDKSMLAWSPDSEHLWVALDKTIVQLDTVTGTLSPPENFSNGNMIGSLALSPDGAALLVRETYDWTFLRDRDGRRRLLGDYLGDRQYWLPDGRRFAGRRWCELRSYDTRTDRRLGTLLPHLSGGQWTCVGPDGHWRGSEGAAELLVYVAQHDDGSIHTYTPAEFAAKFSWKNDPKKARLLALDPK